MPLASDAENRLLAQIAVIKQDLAQGEGRHEATQAKLDRLAASVHDTYANGPGIGPRVLAMNDKPPGGFWSPIIESGTKAFNAFKDARGFTQFLIFLASVFFGLVLTDGGREIIGGLFEVAGGAIEDAGEQLQGDEDPTELPPGKTE